MTNKNILPLGGSDKFFYYTASGDGATMDIRTHYYFKSAVDVNALKSALEKALTLFPEFSYTPVIKEGKLYREQVCATPVKILSPDRQVYYGTDDTNGYLFVVSADPDNSKHVIISAYHGLSDWKGIKNFLSTAMYYYANIELSPDLIAKAGIRTQAPAQEEWQTQENLDPYNKYADKDISPNFAPDMSYYPLPVKYFEVHESHSHNYQITLSLSEFLRKAKSIHASFMPMFINLMAKSVANNYDTGDQNLLFALPADFRSVYNADTIVNFSDAVFIPLTHKELAMTEQDLCAYIKNVINLQRQPENYARNLFNKAQAVRDFEQFDIISKSKELTSSIPGGVTFGTTYLGIMDMPGALNDLFDNIFVDGPFGLSYFMITTFRDVITINSTQRFDDIKIAQALNCELNKTGFETEFTDRGYIKRNILAPEKLRNYER